MFFSRRVRDSINYYAQDKITEDRENKASSSPLSFWYWGKRYSTWWDLQRTKVDLKLSVIRENVKKGKTTRDRKVTWFSRNELIYREFKGDKTYIQLIVSSKYRKNLLRLAHGSILSGLLPTSKTINRILPEFYWPGMKSEIMPFVWYMSARPICVVDKKRCTSILFLGYWWPDTTIYYSLFSNNKNIKYFITCFAVCKLYWQNKYIRNQKFMQLLLSKTSRVKAHCINFTY